MLSYIGSNECSISDAPQNCSLVINSVAFDYLMNGNEEEKCKVRLLINPSIICNYCEDDWKEINSTSLPIRKRFFSVLG